MLMWDEADGAEGQLDPAEALPGAEVVQGPTSVRSRGTDLSKW